MLGMLSELCFLVVEMLGEEGNWRSCAFNFGGQLEIWYFFIDCMKGSDTSYLFVF